jgi:hypothetical protein
MKLGKLNAAIRAAKKVRFLARIEEGFNLPFTLEKTPLLATLAEAFPEGRSQETGLYLNAEGFLSREGDTRMADIPDQGQDEDLVGADDDLIG